MCTRSCRRCVPVYFQPNSSLPAIVTDPATALLGLWAIPSTDFFVSVRTIKRHHHQPGPQPLLVIIITYNPSSLPLTPRGPTTLRVYVRGMEYGDLLYVLVYVVGNRESMHFHGLGGTEISMGYRVVFTMKIVHV